MKIAFRLNKRVVNTFCIILFIVAVITYAMLSSSYAVNAQGIIYIEKSIKSMEAAGNKVVAALDKSIISVDPDTETFKVLAEFDKEIKAIFIDDAGSRLFVSFEHEKEIHIFDIETGRALRKIKTEENPEVFCIDTVSNIAAVKLQGEGIIELTDLSDMSVTKRIKLKDDLSGLWCYPEKGLLFAAAGVENKRSGDKDDDEERREGHDNNDNDKGRLYIISVKGEKMADYAFNNEIKEISIDSTSGKAAILTDDRRIYILDIDTQEVKLLVDLKFLPGDIELKGEILLVTDKENGNLITIDTLTGGILTEEYMGKKAKYIACTNSYCLVSFKDGIRIIEDINLSYPSITDAAVTGITSSSTMVSWSTDQPADSLAAYGETGSYVNSLSDPVMTTVHNLTLTGLMPSTTYNVRITSTNIDGLSSSSDAGTFTTLDPPIVINININYPADGAALSRTDTMVSGTIVNSTGNETGVTVNGVVAVVCNGQFFVNHLPLQDFENTITVSALDTENNRAIASINVFADITQPHVTLNSNIESGISPFDAYFSVDTVIPNSVSTYQMDGNYEGSFDIDYTGTAFDDVSFTYAYEGVYYPMILVTDSAGNGYTDTIAVVVQNKVELDALLQQKWSDMLNAMANQDIAGTLVYYSEDTKQLHSDLYNALYDQLPQLAFDMQIIEPVYIREYTAKYRFRQEEMYGGQLRTFTYYIYFNKDNNGIWKIYRY